MPKALLKNGLKLHYQQVGHGAHIVMIHGLTGNLAVWHLRIVPALWDHFQILTYDLRGHGYSDAPATGYTADDMADDLAQLMDELAIERTVIVGHSYGADIALYFALRYPKRVTQIIAIEAALPAMIHIRNREEWEGWAYWGEYLEQSGYPVPPERRSDVNYLLRLSLQAPKKWGPLQGLPRNPKPFLHLLDNTTLAQDYEHIGSLTFDRLSQIQTPVVLIYTEGSAFLGTCQRLYADLPQARAVILPRTAWGHFGPLEQPEKVTEHILAALQSGDGPSATVVR